MWDGIDEDFANARRSILSSRTEPGSSDPGLFDNSLPGQARELFNVCYLPGLLNFKKGWPIESPTGTDTTWKAIYARPATVSESANGGISYEDPMPANICTIANFDRGKNRIQSGLYDLPDCTSPTWECILNQIVNAVNWQGSSDIVLTSLDSFKEFADNTVNTHIYDYMVDNYQIIEDELWRENIPAELTESKQFICDATQNIPWCFEITHYKRTGALEIIPETIYRPARNVARRNLLESTFGDATNNTQTSFTDIRNAFAGFDEIYDSLNITSPTGGILGLFDNNNTFYTDLTTYYLNTLWISPFMFENYIADYLDFSWIDNKRSNLEWENIQRSASIFEGSAVLLQLNAAKWTQLSPWLKAYLDRTIVEK